MARATVSLNQAISQLRSEAVRNSGKTASHRVEPSTEIPAAMRKIAQLIKQSADDSVSYSDLYAVKTAIYAR